MEPLEWLEAAGIVSRNEMTKDMTPPLTEYCDEEGSFFKVYVADTGIMFHKFGINAELFLSPDSAKMLSSDFRGALAENYVMQSLRRNGIKTFYWTPEGNSRGELDFVFQNSAAQSIPVEVKSARNVTAKSLAKFVRKVTPLMHTVYPNVISDWIPSPTQTCRYVASPCTRHSPSRLIDWRVRLVRRTTPINQPSNMLKTTP